MKKQTRKLALHPETIRLLSDSALDGVVGGGATEYSCLPYPKPVLPPIMLPPKFSPTMYTC
jgi:hypothetical protein